MLSPDGGRNGRSASGRHTRRGGEARPHSRHHARRLPGYVRRARLEFLRGDHRQGARILACRRRVHRADPAAARVRGGGCRMSAIPEAVVVFGASGFVGRNIVDALSGRIGTLIGITNGSAQVPGCTAVCAIDRLADVATLPLDTVAINAAAVRYDPRTFHAQQSQILQRNVGIANAVYAFCVARKIAEVRLASSVAVYPAGWPLLSDEKPVDLNEWPHEGEAGYAWSNRWA